MKIFHLAWTDIPEKDIERCQLSQSQNPYEDVLSTMVAPPKGINRRFSYVVLLEKGMAMPVRKATKKTTSQTGLEERTEKFL